MCARVGVEALKATQPRRPREPTRGTLTSHSVPRGHAVADIAPIVCSPSVECLRFMLSSNVLVGNFCWVFSFSTFKTCHGMPCRVVVLGACAHCMYRLSVGRLCRVGLSRVFAAWLCWQPLSSLFAGWLWRESLSSVFLEVFMECLCGVLGGMFL